MISKESIEKLEKIYRFYDEEFIDEEEARFELKIIKDRYEGIETTKQYKELQYKLKG